MASVFHILPHGEPLPRDREPTPAQREMLQEIAFAGGFTGRDIYPPASMAALQRAGLVSLGWGVVPMRGSGEVRVVEITDAGRSVIAAKHRCSACKIGDLTLKCDGDLWCDECGDSFAPASLTPSPQASEII